MGGYMRDTFIRAAHWAALHVAPYPGKLAKRSIDAGSCPSVTLSRTVGLLLTTVAKPP